jgi:CMP-N-acetylneuraminic acid synthetase
VVDVCLHALEQLENAGDSFDHLVVLLPTSPFRGARHVSAALDRYLESGVGFLMSVSSLDHSLLAAHVVRDGLMEPLHPQWIGRLGARARKEELPHLVKANGAVTVLNVERFRAERSYYVYPLAAYAMPWPDGLDVDTEEDLLFAECLLSRGRVDLET